MRRARIIASHLSPTLGARLRRARATVSKVERSVSTKPPSRSANEPSAVHPQPVDMRDQPSRPAFVWLVVLVCVVYAGFFAFTAYELARHHGVVKAPGWAIRATNAGWFVSDVDAAGPAAGRIRRGDRLLAINGDDRYATLGIFNWRLVDGGSTYRIDLDRRGERVSLALPMPLVSGKQLYPLLGLIGLVFFVCGAFLGLARPQDAQVRRAGPPRGSAP